ncbi:hypothetical protein Bbelb_049180 [Branchiostoma belcheri]|nr:hypothetical protein Bbelb_049180 [Branchiostoma belcheri]
MEVEKGPWRVIVRVQESIRPDQRTDVHPSGLYAVSRLKAVLWHKMFGPWVTASARLVGCCTARNKELGTASNDWCPDETNICSQIYGWRVQTCAGLYMARTPEWFISGPCAGPHTPSVRVAHTWKCPYIWNFRACVREYTTRIRRFSSSVNQYVVADHFKMEGMKKVQSLLQPNDWMATLDIKDALYMPAGLRHVLLHMTHVAPPNTTRPEWGPRRRVAATLFRGLWSYGYKVPGKMVKIPVKVSQLKLAVCYMMAEKASFEIKVAVTVQDEEGEAEEGDFMVEEHQYSPAAASSNDAVARFPLKNVFEGGNNTNQAKEKANRQAAQSTPVTQTAAAPRQRYQEEGIKADRDALQAMLPGPRDAAALTDTVGSGTAIRRANDLLRASHPRTVHLCHVSQQYARPFPSTFHPPLYFHSHPPLHRHEHSPSQFQECLPFHICSCQQCHLWGRPPCHLQCR